MQTLVRSQGGAVRLICFQMRSTSQRPTLLGFVLQRLDSNMMTRWSQDDQDASGHAGYPQKIGCEALEPSCTDTKGHQDIPA